MLIQDIQRTHKQVRQDLDSEGLARAIRTRIRGDVRFDAGSRALYATDGSNYRQVPIGVVRPRDVDDVVETIAVCRQYGAPLLPRGAGTSLAGQCCNVAVVLDFSKYMHHLLHLDPDRRRAVVQPGLILDDLRRAAEVHQLTFGPDPSTHNRCTMGGMIGNSCGVRSLMAGRTSDNVEELDILTYDGCRMRVGATTPDDLDRIVRTGGRRGEIYGRLRDLRDRFAKEIRQRYPQLERRVSGYDLPALLPERDFQVARALAGSEGTCITVLHATVRLVPSPPKRALLVLGYPTVYEVADHILDIRAHGPIGLEGMDDYLILSMGRKGLRQEEVKLLPEGGGWLLVEFGGDTQDEANHRARGLMEALKRSPGTPSMALFEDPLQQHHLWKVREAGLAGTAHVPLEPEAWTGWEDSAVPPEHLGHYLRALRQLMERYGYRASFYGHFGQGCLHTRIPFDLRSQEGIRQFRSFVEEASDLVLRFGGSFSGEHGDGQSRGELLDKMFGPELMEVFREFKSIWDPHWKMNPGKLIDAYRITENLRLGTEYRPPEPATQFKWPADNWSFAKTSLRCVGVGECVRMRGGTMCPSYMVTREEMYSTRGRARLLFEVLQGDPLKDGWRDTAVREALDLCLACKGCLTDCPVNVDMATYKAEFLSHHYAGRVRPQAAYSMGLIYWWARLAAGVPRLANLLTQTQPFAALVKALGDMTQARSMLPFAPRPLRNGLPPAGRQGQRTGLE